MHATAYVPLRIFSSWRCVLVDADVYTAVRAIHRKTTIMGSHVTAGASSDFLPALCILPMLFIKTVRQRQREIRHSLWHQLRCVNYKQTQQAARILINSSLLASIAEGRIGCHQARLTPMHCGRALVQVMFSNESLATLYKHFSQ